jgi:hypothetical protein
MKRWSLVLMGALVAMGVSPASWAQAWQPPAGIPHPGDWFLREAGDVQPVTSGGGSRTFEGTGTAEAPMIFRGDGSPTFTGTVAIRGTYVIVEGILVDGGQVSIGGDHVALRDSEVRNHRPGGNSTAVVVDDGSSDIVVFRSRVHDNGDVSSATENDVHGIGGGSNSQRVWILDNETYRNGGDSVQFGHNQDNTLSHVYIGRNLMHEDRENAVDIKETSDVIISENEMFGYRATTSSEGAAIVVHYCPINANVLFNDIHDSEVGISSTSLLSDCPTPVSVRFLGNVIHQIQGTAIQGWGADKITAVVGNTIHEVGGAGIDLDHLAPGSVIENNILSAIEGADITTTGAVLERNNLTGTDALFVNAPAGVFLIQEQSPARNTGIASDSYAGFQALYGLDIRRDARGLARPQEGAWDIGAYEFTATAECGDGIDNDGDGRVDHPDDSGCGSADDVDESDCGDGVCEGGETCLGCEEDCTCVECADADGDGFGRPSAGCASALEDCDDGRASVYPGASEACNGLDDDCSGAADEPWDDELGGACASGVGACAVSGIYICAQDGSAAVCDAVPGSGSAEVCGNSIDEDCDGSLDNGCDCMAGESRYCYDGASGTSGIGVCRGGLQGCVGDRWGECVGQVLPSQEACEDGLDNDCDGLVDDLDSSDCPAEAGGGCGCGTAGGPGPVWILVASLLSVLRGRHGRRREAP